MVLQSMSIGFLVDEASPMVWRGPMVTQALEQLLKNTEWEDVDYMIIDMPPGTGDTQLTLSQKDSSERCGDCNNASRHCAH